MTDQEPAIPATSSGLGGLPPTPPLQPEAPALPPAPAVATEAFVPPSTGYRAPRTSTAGRPYEIPSIPLPDPIDPTRARRAAMAAVALGALLLLAPFLAWYRVDVVGVHMIFTGYGAEHTTFPDVASERTRAEFQRDPSIREEFRGHFGLAGDGYVVGALGAVVIGLGITGAVGWRGPSPGRLVRRRGPVALVAIGLAGLCWLVGSVKHTVAAIERLNAPVVVEWRLHLGIALLVSAVLFLAVAACGATAVRNG